MTSAKHHRYGQGGSKHKKVTESGRPNGKAFKRLPKAFNTGSRRLVSVGQKLKGLSI
jgi:hypothetical protein